MSDKPKSKKKTAAPPKSGRELSREQAKLLRARAGIQIDRGLWDDPPEPETATDTGLVCAFCGADRGAFREIFDGKHDVIICLDCLEASEESGTDRIQ